MFDELERANLSEDDVLKLCTYDIDGDTMSRSKYANLRFRFSKRSRDA